MERIFSQSGLLIKKTNQLGCLTRWWNYLFSGSATRCNDNLTSCILSRPSVTLLAVALALLALSASLTRGNVHCSHVLLCLVHSAVITYNAALNRPAYMSSVASNSYGYYSAHLANDGNRDTKSTSGGVPTCAHSKRETNPWWAVDLGRPTAVYRVDFTARGDLWGMKKRMLVSHYRVYTRGMRKQSIFQIDRFY